MLLLLFYKWYGFLFKALHSIELIAMNFLKDSYLFDFFLNTNLKYTEFYVQIWQIWNRSVVRVFMRRHTALSLDLRIEFIPGSHSYFQWPLDWHSNDIIALRPRFFGIDSISLLMAMFILWLTQITQLQRGNLWAKNHKKKLNFFPDKSEILINKLILLLFFAIFVSTDIIELDDMIN